MKLKKISKNILTAVISLTAIFAMLLTPVNAADASTKVVKTPDVKISELTKSNFISIGTNVINDTNKEIQMKTYVVQKGSVVLHRLAVGETLKLDKKIDATNPDGTTVSVETESNYWSVMWDEFTTTMTVNSLSNQQILDMGKQAINAAVIKKLEGKSNFEFNAKNEKSPFLDEQMNENIKRYLESDNLPSDGITVKWKEPPTIVKATTTAEGSLKGIVVVTRGSASIEITVDEKIYKGAPSQTEQHSFMGSAAFTWTKGTQSTQIKIKGAMDDIVAVKVDGKAIDASKFGMVEVQGVTALLLKPSYLETLSVGKHKLEVVYTDSVISKDVIIKVTATKNNGGAPKTSDATNITYLIGMLGISALATIIIKKKREN